VLIAYEDFETGKNGKKTFDFLVNHLGEDFVFSNQMWKFDILSVPKLREMAAKDVAEADIIIVSAHGQSDLPDDVKAWIELWIKEKLQAVALVALFDREQFLDNPARSYLAGVASRANLEFFSQPATLPQSETFTPPLTGFEHSDRTVSVLAGMETFNKDISRWGINE
jgi:hypothetical protein